MVEAIRSIFQKMERLLLSFEQKKRQCFPNGVLGTCIVCKDKGFQERSDKEELTLCTHVSSRRGVK